jgi:hypothetical protein
MIERETYASLTQDPSDPSAQTKASTTFECWTGSCCQKGKTLKNLMVLVSLATFLLILPASKEKWIISIGITDLDTSIETINKNSSSGNLTYLPSMEELTSPLENTAFNASIETVNEDASSSDNPHHVKQIENYINGTALILSIHITHHAGTFLCSSMRQIGPTPEFACMGGENWPSNISITSSASEWVNHPTSMMVEQIRPSFHFVSTEHQHWANLHTINLEYKDLVSIIVLRHPIDRFLAGGKCGSFHKSIQGDPTGTPEDNVKWWEYANSDCADNYALRVLAPNRTCCSDDDTNSAKSLIKRFTFVIDQNCLDESLLAVESKLNMRRPDNSKAQFLHKTHPSARERIGNETLWQFLNHKFRHDIDLYEWSKNISIVKCI